MGRALMNEASVSRTCEGGAEIGEAAMSQTSLDEGLNERGRKGQGVQEQRLCAQGHHE